MAAGDGHIPIRGYAFRFTGTSYKDGLPLALLGTIDSEISKDGGTYANCDPGEAVALKEVGGSTDSPDFVLELSATEMTCAHAVVQVKSEATDTQHYHIFPKALPAWLTGTSQAGGSTTSIKLAATAPAYDISGTWVGVDSGACSGQVREIVSYNTTTKVATVVRAFSEAPDAMTYSVLVPEALVSALTVRAMLALPAVAPAAAGGLPTFGTGTGQLNVAGGRADADLKYLFGTTLTEAAGAGKLAAALSKLLDVATPLLVASSAMRGTDGAELTGAAAAAVATLNNLSSTQAQAATAAALDVAIPGTPTANSINERVKALDDLTQASGGGDLAALLARVLAVTDADSVLLDAAQRTAVGNAILAIDEATGAVDYEAIMATGTTVGAFIAACRAVLVGKLTAPSATTKRYYDAAGTAHYIAQTHGADYTTRETPTQG